MDAAERKAVRREQLLEAGLATFGSQGFHATRVRDVCVEASLTERYFYESFANREALFAAVFDRCVDIVRAGMEQAMAENAHLAPFDMARESMRRYLTTLRGNPKLVRVLLIDAIGIDADMGRKSVSAGRSFTDLIVPTLSALFPDLSEQGLSLQQIADGLVGSTLFIVTQWALNDFESPLDEVLNTCMLFYTSIGQVLAVPAPPDA